MQITKIQSTLACATSVMLGMLLLLTVYVPTPVKADHTTPGTLPYCEEQFGASGNADYDNCVNEVEDRCLQNFQQNNNEAAYEICLNGQSATGGGSAGGGQDTQIDEFTPTPDPLICDDAGDSACCNGVKIGIDVECTDADNPILGWLGGVINFLLGGVILVITAVIVASGIQYITAGGVPQRLESARKRIFNAVIALVVFLFLYTIIQWAIPGGII